MSEMKLSEAMRLGSMNGPQIFGFSHDRETGGTCALGAVYIASGVDKLGGRYETLSEKFPMLAVAQATTCPACQRIPRFAPWDGTVHHLNDDHRWSREQIADWVETIERAQETPVGCADQLAMEPALALPSAAQKCI